METTIGTARSVKVGGQNFHLYGQPSGQPTEREALGHAPHLSVRSGRHKTIDRVGKSRVQLGQNRGHGVGFGQFVQEGAARVAVMNGGQFLEAVDHGSGMRETVQFGEHGRIHRKPDETHLLPASGFQPVFSQLVGKTEFAAGEKEQTPGMGFAQIALAAGAALALTVGQHVSTFGQDTPVDLSDFIQNQHIVVVQDSDVLKAVVRGAPASDVFRAAPDGRGNLEGRCLARRTTALKAESAALQTGQTQQRPGKGRTQGKTEAGIADGKYGDFPPTFQSSGGSVQIAVMRGLQNHAFGGVAVHGIRQDVGGIVPAGAGHTADTPGGPDGGQKIH